MFGRLPGSDPARAVAAKLRREIEAKSAARRYEQHCESCGLSPIEAKFLAPGLVKEGQSLRRVEEKRRSQQAFQARKEAMRQKFGGGR